MEIKRSSWLGGINEYDLRAAEAARRQYPLAFAQPATLCIAIACSPGRIERILTVYLNLRTRGLNEAKIQQPMRPAALVRRGTWSLVLPQSGRGQGIPP